MDAIWPLHGALQLGRVIGTAFDVGVVNECNPDGNYPLNSPVAE